MAVSIWDERVCRNQSLLIFLQMPAPGNRGGRAGRIDPSITVSDNTHSAGAIEDASVYSLKPNMNAGTWTYNHAGYYDSICSYYLEANGYTHRFNSDEGDKTLGMAVTGEKRACVSTAAVSGITDAGELSCAVHEFGHMLGAPDHYCKGDNGTAHCSNVNCFSCNNGGAEPPRCLMKTAQDFVDALDSPDIYCASCREVISQHLLGHHFAE